MIPRILLQPPRGFNKMSQNTNGMLFLYPSEGTQVGLYILYGNVCVHFIQDAEKKAKKCVLNLHANICCCRNTATFFYCMISRVPKKPLQRHCYRLYLNVFSKTKMSMCLNLQHVHLKSATTFLTPPPPLPPIIFVKYINILFL